MQEELISKKELLLETGISYGQLYRWKRQNLIPDAWFIKQSAYTGQETFFPRRRVLERIASILQLKDRHSLDELASYFAPESGGSTYAVLDALEAMGLGMADAELYIRLSGKRRATFMELLLLSLLPALGRDTALSPAGKEAWLRTASKWAHAGFRTEQAVIAYRSGGRLAYLLLDADCQYQLDEGSVWIATYELAEQAKQLQLMLRTIKEG